LFFKLPDYKLHNYNSTQMDLAPLLAPYIKDLSSTQLAQVQSYLDLLLRWNARMNLTAIRDPEQIIIRHFGESFFLSSCLFGNGTVSGFSQLPITNPKSQIVDVGSGAGFPGIPIKIARPEITLTLVEAQQRKATFLREVLRTLNLDAEVKNVRAESLAAQSADVVTLRAVEKFDSILPVAASLVRRARYGPDQPSGRLAILIGEAQVARAQELLPKWQFRPVLPIPSSQNRVILIGNPAS
jgi:16S rRNA (guanine527-N7)-methyltransferase